MKTQKRSTEGMTTFRTLLLFLEAPNKRWQMKDIHAELVKKLKLSSKTQTSTNRRITYLIQKRFIQKNRPTPYPTYQLSSEWTDARYFHSLIDTFKTIPNFFKIMKKYYPKHAPANEMLESLHTLGEAYKEVKKNEHITNAYQYMELSRRLLREGYKLEGSHSSHLTDMIDFFIGPDRDVCPCCKRLKPTKPNSKKLHELRLQFLEGLDYIAKGGKYGREFNRKIRAHAATYYYFLESAGFVNVS